MHELSIAQAMVRQVGEILKNEHGDKVLEIQVALGKMSGIDPGSLEFAFPFAAEGTPRRPAQH